MRSVSTKQRFSNLELYRILVMMCIIAHHYVVNSGVLELLSDTSLTMQSAYYHLFGMWGKTGINCFVLITGYFMCKSKLTIRKYLKLLLQVKFYDCAIAIILFWIGLTELTGFQFLKLLVPFTLFSPTSFTNGFLSFFILIPILNYIINRISSKQHLCLAVVPLFLYLPFFRIPVHYTLWFCILYFVSSYIRIYGIYKKNDSSYWGWMALGSVCISWLSVLFMLFIGKSPFYWVSDSNAIMAVVTSICLFMFFKNINLSYNSVINTVASTTFGVFLIHTRGEVLRHWLWYDFIDVQSAALTSYYIIHSLISVIGIFLVCSFIDYLRIILIETPLFGLLDKIFRNNKYYS